jgi:beta-lactamase class A
MRQLLDEIRKRIKESEVEMAGVAACDPASGKSILVNAETSFHAASTFKISVMMEVFHQAQQGCFSLEDDILVKNVFKSIADQSNFSLSAEDDSETGLYSELGKSLPIRELVTRMITHSSNLATNILIELVTPGKVTDFMHELGATGLLVLRGVEDSKAFAVGINNAASARSLMEILKQLALHQVVSPEASEAMIAIMKQQQFNEGIPRLLPKEVSTAHKTGSIKRLYHDAAILHPPGQEAYVCVIMTKGLAEDKEGPELVSVLAKLIYDAQPEWRPVSRDTTIQNKSREILI